MTQKHKGLERVTERLTEPEKTLKRTGLAALVVMACLLAGCAGGSGPVTPQPARTDAESPSETAAPPAAPATDSKTPPPPVRRPNFQARAFIGLDGRAVERALGQPSLRQQETFAEVWRYISGPCILHLFFYRPKGSDADAPFKVEQALIETRPGPWGDNLKPEGVCGLEFSGRIPAATPPRAAPQRPRRN